MEYSLLVTLHVSAFIWNIVLVVLSDTIGLLWCLGKIRQLPERLLNFTHVAIWVGLAVSITSGVFLFIEMKDYLLETTAFYSKLVFVVALIINSFLISRHMHTAFAADSFATLPPSEKRALMISGAISTASWVGAFVSAKLLGL